MSTALSRSPDQVAAARVVLLLDASGEGAHDLREPCGRRFASGWRVAVLGRHVLPEGPGRVLLGQRGQVRVDHRDPLRPAEALAAGELVAEPEHQRALLDAVRDQRRVRGKPLGELQLLDPGGAGPLVVPDRHRRARLPGPLAQLAVGAVHAEVAVGAVRVGGDHRQVGDALDVEEPLAGLAPGARHGVGAEHQPQAGPSAGLGDAQVLHLRVGEADLAGHGGGTVPVRASRTSVANTFCATTHLPPTFSRLR